jgi:hypothetical protein
MSVFCFFRQNPGRDILTPVEVLTIKKSFFESTSQYSGGGEFFPIYDLLSYKNEQ